jgi:hypothetical protein
VAAGRGGSFGGVALGYEFRSRNRNRHPRSMATRDTINNPV